jgi:hypothetical protein
MVTAALRRIWERGLVTVTPSTRTSRCHGLSILRHVDFPDQQGTSSYIKSMSLSWHEGARLALGLFAGQSRDGKGFVA